MWQLLTNGPQHGTSYTLKGSSYQVIGLMAYDATLS
jgi:hypothetical protein